MTAPKVVQVDPVSRVKYVNLGESFNISCTFYEGNPNKNNPLGFTVSKKDFNVFQLQRIQLSTQNVRRDSGVLIIYYLESWVFELCCCVVVGEILVFQ